jgi:hypothetical protein
MEAGMLPDQLCLDDRLVSAPYGALAELDSRHTAILWLNVAESESRAFAQMTAASRMAWDENPAAWSGQSAAALERAARTLVRSLRAAWRARPVIVVRGLPVAPIPPVTPYGGVVDVTASRQSIINLGAVLACLNLHPVAYAGEATSVLHAVCPVSRAAGEVSSHGFDAALPFHTDYADRPIDEPVVDRSPAAAALGFAVERAEPAIPMECVPTARLMRALSPGQIAIGRREEFVVQAPAIFGGGQSAQIRRLFPGDTGPGFRCRLNLGRMTGATARAARLLREIHDILSGEIVTDEIHVRRGDIVVMDNRRTIHRRASFTPRWDGTDRYFIRMSATRDPLARLPSDPRRPWVWT